MTKFDVKVNSEIGKLSGVILHTPGPEVENMTPQNAEKALYSDILNLSVAREEYSQLKGVLNLFTQTFEVKELLEQTLEDAKTRMSFIHRVCEAEGAMAECDYLMGCTPSQLANQLMEGVELKRDNLTRFLSGERFSMRPLHNFLFTRDASMTMGDEVLIGKMASRVRERESIIMETIFKKHPQFGVNTLNPDLTPGFSNDQTTVEGGDVLIAREDILVIGTGSRTSTQGIDFLIENIKKKNCSARHIIVQELPQEPESFIHLDMTFTFLDKNKCMAYAPLILEKTKYQTIRITIDNGEVREIRQEDGLLPALRKLGIDLEPVQCGGAGDPWSMEREQWHSGANFFAIAPGQVIGYERNNYTIEEMVKHGFRAIKAQDLIDGKDTLSAEERAVITIAGSELSRGGGGARCMTMPVGREKLIW